MHERLFRDNDQGIEWKQCVYVCVCWRGDFIRFCAGRFCSQQDARARAVQSEAVAKTTRRPRSIKAGFIKEIGQSGARQSGVARTHSSEDFSLLFARLVHTFPV